MKSHTTGRFRKAFQELPSPIQRQAREAYKLFKHNPYHPSLHFKPVHPTRPIYSVRVGLDYRALGVRDGDDLIWFWIGFHSNYDKLITRL